MVGKPEGKYHSEDLGVHGDNMMAATVIAFFGESNVVAGIVF